MSRLRQRVLGSAAATALLCASVTPANAALPLFLLLGHLLVNRHAVVDAARFATRPLAAASVAWAAEQSYPYPSYPYAQSYSPSTYAPAYSAAPVYGAGQPVSSPPYYYANPPVYYRGPPVYYTRPPVYYAQSRVYYPPRAYYRSGVSYASPPSRYYGSARSGYAPGARYAASYSAHVARRWGGSAYRRR
jgi:hypothetical protein